MAKYSPIYFPSMFPNRTKRLSLSSSIIFSQFLWKKHNYFRCFRGTCSLKPSSSIPIFRPARISFCFHSYCYQARDCLHFFMWIWKSDMQHFKSTCALGIIWAITWNKREIKIKIGHVELRVTFIYNIYTQPDKILLSFQIGQILHRAILWIAPPVTNFSPGTY